MKGKKKIEKLAVQFCFKYIKSQTFLQQILTLPMLNNSNGIIKIFKE